MRFYFSGNSQIRRRKKVKNLAANNVDVDEEEEDKE